MSTPNPRPIPPPNGASANNALPPPQKPKRQKKEKKPKKNVPVVKNTVSGLIKALVYLALVILVSIILAVFSIAVVNDFLAFNQPEDSPSVVLTITEEDDLVSISRMLQDEGIIRFPSLWRIFARIRMTDDYGELRPFHIGEVTVNAAMNFNSLVSRVMRGPAEPDTITIVIPEGFRIDDIIDRVVAAGIGTREEFVRVINYHEFNFWFMSYIPEWQGDDDPRFYRLEGFLFPDTHFFFENVSEVHVVQRMLSTFNDRFNRANMEYIAEINRRWGLTDFGLYDFIILASLIQSEARQAGDFPVVGSVFLNRLRSPQFPNLESDATTAYIIRHVEGAMRRVLPSDLTYWMNHPFSTYGNPGLPPSPINNPGLQAIQAAFYSGDLQGRQRGDNGFIPYYFFVTDEVHFSAWFGRTYAEHQSNIAAINRGEYRVPDGYDDFD